MNRQNRRAFLQTSAATALAAPFGRRFLATKDAVVSGDLPIESIGPAQSAPSVAANEGKKPLRLGLIIGIGKDPDAAMAKRSRSTKSRPPPWPSDDQEQKFGTSIKGRSRLAWFRAKRALRESPTSKRPQILPNNVASKPCRRIADSYRRIPMIRSTRKRSQCCERWLATAEVMGRPSATRPARRRPSRSCARFRR